MERLTEKAPRPSVNSQYVKRKGFYTADCIERLGIYEDTGLTPEQILELKERDTEKAPKICKNKYSDTYTCPNCALALVRKGETGWFCGKHYTYCPDCGQRLKWEV